MASVTEKLTENHRVIHFVILKVNVNKTHIKYFFHDISFLLQSLNVDTMCGTLHLLNDFHAKCVLQALILLR